MKTIALPKNYFILVDDEDYERVNKLSWSERSGSVRHTIHNYDENGKDNSTSIALANFIMNRDSVVFDHIDTNPFNNQKSNLRECNTYQNAANRNKRSDSVGIYKGVSRLRSTGKYRARITYMGKTTQIGIYKTDKEAALAYNKAAIELFKEFANLNII